MDTSFSFDICIIGCGLSGLTSLHYLLEHSISKEYKICLIEGRERVGGRTNTIVLEHLKNSLKECYVDIGGQWIGNDHFKALSIISKYNLQLEEQIYPSFHSTHQNSEEVTQQDS